MSGLLPEGALAMGAVAAAALARVPAGRRAAGPIAIVALLAAGAALLASDLAPASPVAFRTILLASALLALLAPRDAVADPAAFPAMVLLATAGLGAAATAGDLVLLAAGLEVAGLATSRLAGGRRISVAASALLWFGLATLHGLAGTTSLAGLARLCAGGASPAEGAALLLVLAGLGIRLAALPLHGWLTEPRGRPAAVGFVAAAGITCALAVIDRLLAATGAPAPTPGSLLPALDALPFALTAVLGVLAIAGGALGSLRAERTAGWLGGLAVTQGGLAVLALSTGTDEGRTAAVLAAMVLVPTVQGGLLAADRRRERGGLPLLGATVVLLLAAIGLPPTGGFVGRVVSVDAIVGAGFPVLALAAAVGALLPAAALPGHLRTALERRHGSSPGLRTLAIGLAAAAAALAIGLGWDSLFRTGILP